jgi:mannose-6-phosphate isomerase class I
LHVREGLEVMRETTGAGKVAPELIDGHDLLVSSPCFIVERFKADAPLTMTSEPGKSSAQVLVAVEGCGVVECENSQPISFNRGEAIIIPAAQRQVTLRPQWNIEFLRMRLPGDEVKAPSTSMV